MSTKPTCRPVAATAWSGRIRPTGSPVWGYAFGGVLQGDGRLVTAGTRTDMVLDDVIMLARYETACAPLGTCTPCTRGRYLGDVKLEAGRLRPPAGDETMTLIGRGTLPQSADLAATGIRIVLEEPDVDVSLDATVPGGPFGVATKSGWNGAAGKFRYRHAGTVTPRPGGVAKRASKIDARGRLTLKVQITEGSVPITEASLPLQAWIALDPPAGASGACVVMPATTACALDATGSTLRCG